MVAGLAVPRKLQNKNYKSGTMDTAPAVSTPAKRLQKRIPDSQTFSTCMNITICAERVYFYAGSV